MTSPRIEVAALTKYYGNNLVLDGIDLKVAPHEVVCLCRRVGLWQVNAASLYESIRELGPW